MEKYSYIIQYDEENEIYIASIPELQGCMAHGKTPEDAIREVRIVMEMWLEVAEEKGLEIPKPLTQNNKIA
ncbi:MAG: type II toxin-antitoxin system HicB family antitoxin [Lachnospiraceae bacterium]|nr:type II toxin-antitoxin system HicB family antitoxin [Lachnospiraceae bacterium]